LSFEIICDLLYMNRITIKYHDSNDLETILQLFKKYKENYDKEGHTDKTVCLLENLLSYIGNIKK